MNDVLIDIKTIIDKFGYYRYVVKQRKTPRYSYTIGLFDRVGFELIMCGCMFFEANQDLKIIFDHIINSLLIDKNARKFNIVNIGNFKLLKVHTSWVNLMMLGATDYYSSEKILTFQIIPTDREKCTIDTPNMTKRWNENDLIWKYLNDDITWRYNIPEDSVAITNLRALQGSRLTEFFRYEKDEWEIFSGNGAAEKNELIRIVPLSVLIGADPTIECFINEPVGSGKYRDFKNLKNATWYNWA